MNVLKDYANKIQQKINSADSEEIKPALQKAPVI
jgi:hypothetical protein